MHFGNAELCHPDRVTPHPNVRIQNTMTPSPPTKSELTAVIYRQFERRLKELKAAAPFSTGRSSEYYRRAEEIRALYRAVRKLESMQVLRPL